MVEEEDRVQARGLILAHVAVGTRDRRTVALAWVIEATDCQVHEVMRLFQGYMVRACGVGFVFRGGRGGIGEQGVGRGIQAVFEAGEHLTTPLATDLDLAVQPGTDVVIEVPDVLLSVRELRIVCVGLGAVLISTDQAGQRVTHRLIAFRLAVDDRGVLDLVGNGLGEHE
ncbi:hypothetical protein D3C81_1523490 [compost metagenome]